MTKSELASEIAEVALLRGEFTLRSGRKSNYYLDKYRFETEPKVLAEIGKMIAGHVGPDIKRLAGPELGAVPLATAASLVCGVPTLFVRNSKKEYGSAKQIEGVYEKGDKIILIEDIVTTGGQVVEAAKALREVGLVIDKVIVTIDRLEGGRENIVKENLNYIALFDTKDLGIV